MASSKTSSSKVGTTETKLVRELAEILNETSLSEIEISKGELTVRVSKGGTVVAAAAPAAPVATPAPAVETPAPTTKADASAHPGAEKSPMVGTAYLRPSPDADNFVSVGSSVKEATQCS